MTKERLKAYRDLKVERDTIRGLIKNIDRDLQAPKVPRLGNVSGGGNKKGVSPVDVKIDKKSKLIALYHEIDSKLDAELLEVEKAIKAAPLQSRERTLLRLYYIKAMTWEQVCCEMGYSLRQIYRIHDKALEQLNEMAV